MKILVLDNYDSFVYNLVHILRELGQEPDVIRNDKISLEEVAKYDKILLSPGPGIPSEAGIMPELIKKYGSSKSILGVCLGHQAIGEAFGADLINMKDVLHGIQGVATQTDTRDTVFFEGAKDAFEIAHYHSWAIERASLEGTDLLLTAVDKDGQVMAVKHKDYDVRGVQFHPESVLTEGGKQMIKNWLEN
ncbi:anthranilate synthase component II [Sediminitomix flava]|uniref:anthranilate synthase component II n=1 Tax=Sediminitomix flava TaxID=379075 RepID=UPI000D6CC775|nr:aminodeoxychorismate/anthranilate synthase component II [Sediminitomix flava]